MSSHQDAQPVDFHKPQRMASSARQAGADWYVRSIMRIQENCKQHLAEGPQLTSVNSDVVLARDAFQEVADPGWGSVVHVGPHSFPSLLAFPLVQVQMLVNAVIGATGEERPAERPLTAVEVELARLILGDLARGFADGWPGESQLAVELGAVENRPCRSRMFSPQTPVYVSTFRLSQSLGEFDFQWIQPEEALARLVERNSSGWDARPPATSRAVLDHLARKMPVEIVVELGHVPVTMPQLSRLSVGDVLVLGQSIHDPLTARVGDETKFRGWAGRSGIRRGFQITVCVDDP